MTYDMKAIIDGKRYDTDTATQVAENSARFPCSDFAWYEESLYRTKRGAWFLAGRGGPSSHYARPVDRSSRSGGEAIRPLTDLEAREWCERTGNTEAIEQHMAEMVEDA
jgi:hypothetical protein